MKKKYIRPLLLLSVIGALSLSLFFCMYRADAGTRMISPVNSVLTIREDTFQHGFVFLDGPINLCLGLYTPDTYPEEAAVRLDSLRCSYDPSDITYSVTFQGDGCKNACLLFPLLRSYRVWVNSTEVLNDNGTPLSSINILSLADYPALPDGSWDMTVQLSETSRAKTSYIGFMLGTQAQLQRVHFFWISTNMIALGIYFYLIINCLSLYFQKRSEHYLLYLCLLIFQAAIQSVCSSIYPFSYVLTGRDIPPIIQELARLSLPLRIMLLHVLFPNTVKKAVVTGSLLLFGVSVLLLAGNLLSLPYCSILLSYMVHIFINVELLFILIAFMREEPGSTIMLSGILLYTSMRIYSILSTTSSVIPTGIVGYYYFPWQYGHLLYMIAYAVAINGIFARKYRLSDELAYHLSQMNETLQDRIEERTNQLAISKNELQKSYETLIQHQKDKNDFLNNIVHNLRTPLFSLCGTIEILQTKYAATQEQSHLLQRADDKVKHIQHMINDLFLLVRMDDNTVSFHMLAFDFIVFLRQIVDDYSQPDAPQICLQLPQDCSSIFFVGDSYYIRQAIENILDNAIRYSPPSGSIELQLSQPDNILKLTISDCGPGITPEDLPKIFERYYKGKIYTGSQTGLGLAITREIILKHNGSITAANRIDRSGAVFTICLPLEIETVPD